MASLRAFAMPLPDTDKPPICSPAPVAVYRAARPHVDAAAPCDPVDAAPLTAWRPTTSQTALHWTFLALGFLVVAASFLLEIRDHEHVALPGTDVTLPGTCTFRELTGMPCPGCGLTRSFISVVHGRCADAWEYNPAGFLFFAIVVFQIPYRIYQLVRIRRGRGQHYFVWIDAWVLTLLIISLLAQWIYRLTAAAM